MGGRGRDSSSGTYVTSTTAGEVVRAFVPAPLPQSMTGLSAQTRPVVERALVALGRLDSAAAFLPNRALLLYYYVRKEAVLSSQIEGTQSSLADLLLFEADEPTGVPLDDVAGVSCYVRALEHGVARLREGFPLSNRLIREIHQRLMASGRGENKAPGEFRRTQNWIGGTRPGKARFVPPPPDRLADCMSDLERFLNREPGHLGIIEKAAMAHVQFETIHPFLDGNGRLGRLLIALLLVHDLVLREPVLYVSLYFKTHRDEYYACLDRVRTHSDWDAWIRFCAEAIGFAAAQAAETAQRLNELEKEHRTTIHDRGGRKAGSDIRVFDMLTRRPVIHIQEICAGTGLTPNTVAAALERLQQMGIAREVTGKKRNRLFAYQKYLEVMSEGTDALPR